MINIVSTQARLKRISGPFKVYENLVKGLNILEYPYVVNYDLNAATRLWIHDDHDALRYIQKSRAYKTVGPNLYVMPVDVPTDVKLCGVQYIQPCDWASQMWEYVGFNSCPIVSWAVGIDSEEFHPSSISRNMRSVMVYYKMRDPQGLPHIFQALHDRRLPYTIVVYQDYSELEYKELLDRTSFIVWYGRAESQGIALQEAMAANVPILVCDVNSVAETRGGYHFDSTVHNFPVTAAPYFDDTCGVIIKKLADVGDAIDIMLERLNEYQPREYIKHNLSLEGQAKKFVELWNAWGLTVEEGYHETINTSRKWYGPPLVPMLTRQGASKLIKIVKGRH